MTSWVTAVDLFFVCFPLTRNEEHNATRHEAQTNRQQQQQQTSTPGHVRNWHVAVMDVAASPHADQGQCGHEAPALAAPFAALAVLNDPVLSRNITTLMTRWPFPVFRLRKQCVPKYTLCNTP